VGEWGKGEWGKGIKSFYIVVYLISLQKRAEVLYYVLLL
jgi:hypothetical protein